MKRAAPLRRRSPLARIAPRRRPAAPRPQAPPRDWSDARAKVDAEGACRVCSAAQVRLEAAHTIGRVHDRPRIPGGPLWVDPLDVVPLCVDDHRAYDARRLDLLPHLSREEQAAAVAHVGIARALRRLSGTQAVTA